MTSDIEEFKEAMRLRGIKPPLEILADGKIHRCDTEESNGKSDASYYLHLNGIAAGGFNNWQDGKSWERWRSNRNKGDNKKFQDAYGEAAKKTKSELLKETQQRQSEAKEKAEKIWNEAQPCGTHPYLEKKQIAPNGARINLGQLILPITDSSGQIQSLQFIDASGSKRFMPGGKTKDCFLTLEGGTETICIAEGFATGASIYQATGNTVVIAFSADNLIQVAKRTKVKFPNSRIVICADDDFKKVNNPGLSKATEAAKAINGHLAIPHFLEPRLEHQTDFNDLHIAQDFDAVRSEIENAASVQAEIACLPLNENEISFVYAGGKFATGARGIFYVGRDKDGNDMTERWICSPIQVLAQTRNNSSEAWGRFLQWTDPDNTIHKWAMPMELLQGDGAEVRKELSRRGVHIATMKSDRDKLTEFIQNFPIDKKARCVERLGWFGPVYVTSNESIGQTEAQEEVVFQNSYPIDSGVSYLGSVKEWTEHVSKLTAGNPRLVFAISAAFAGPLLEISGLESGGFHFRGTSSTGKTTALKLASSVWGNPSQFLRSWRTTANGLEGVAALHNDSILLLDELSQIDPNDAGEVAYLLSNGQGKTRADKIGTARKITRWRLLYLSSGEESLSAIMTKVGKRPKAGQEIRFADISADAGWGWGIFESLNGFASPGEMATKLNELTNKYYGSVGLEWLRLVVQNRLLIEQSIANKLEEFCERVLTQGSQGQVRRVAKRFALISIAGELASSYGLTGWEIGEAEKAATNCFNSWLESFGGVGNAEKRAMLSQVRAFFEQHGSSRFEDSGKSREEQKINNRAGFIRTANGQPEFLVFTEAFKNEVCKGYDHKTVANYLLEEGWLLRGNDGRPTQKPKLRDTENGSRVYVFPSAKVLEGED